MTNAYDLPPSCLFPSCSGNARVYCEICPNGPLLERADIVVVKVNSLGVRVCCRKSIPWIAPQNCDPVRAKSKSPQHLPKRHQPVNYTSAAVFIQFWRNENRYVGRRTNRACRTDVRKILLIPPVINLVLHCLYNRCNIALRRLGMVADSCL